jgi:hypothetical protein
MVYLEVGTSSTSSIQLGRILPGDRQSSSWNIVLKKE